MSGEGCSHIGPNYSLNQAALEDQKIEVSRYNLDYFLNYVVNYVPDNIENSDYAEPDFFKLKNSSQPRPPVPTSKIPHSRNMNCWLKIINFLLDYWRHLLLGFGVLMVLLAAFLVLFFVVLKPDGGEPRISTTTEAPAPLCPLGFHFINDKCWKFMNQQKTTFEARAVCNSLGAHLVTLKNITENDSLADFTSTNSSLWIGLQCCGNEASACRWMDGSGEYLKDDLDVYPFAEDNPNIFNGRCVYYSNGKWTSDECEMDRMPFVCEIQTFDPLLSHHSPGSDHPNYC